MTEQADEFIRQGLRVLDIEREAINDITPSIDQNFVHACQAMLGCKGRVVVTGMGKSGHIGSKIAATLASTGTPAFFVHPGEASHGDLGMITAQDVVLAMSNSGETQEVVSIIPVIKRLGLTLISMTGNPQSTLARSSNVHINVAVQNEACPLGLAPTASTTAALVMGDALAVALLNARGFTADDFALSHPGGSLGRRLLLRVSDLMHAGERLPKVEQKASIKDALLEISRKGLGMTSIVDEQDVLLGVFTDGDLRRILDLQVDLHETSIASVMTARCITVTADTLAAEALKLMEDKKINGLIVVNPQQCPIGAFNMHDLLRAGVL
ncbi:D-arabinose 5-phosphate isomerase [Aliidiomarina sedimenti]|uniref:Arabinose 5-phosphate isomerase n=1 Tax=Aliidiomarina sedimenti TaxID=1933879 RepID=A0ABY0BZR6_9GAMM|nr:KpsF/GutQ family sugar-phosphate isomerase [Aliidiomarina sedimenti]RUO30597.1 D-arabinose 5-phosphate isomerase [Aliidiomarina sedimenti]